VRVVFFSLMPGLGGPARSLAGLLEGLAGNAERVVVVPPGRLRDLLIHQRLAEKVVAIPPSSLGRLGRLQATWMVARESRRADLLHCNGHTEFLVAAAPVLAQRIPVVSHFRTTELSGWSLKVGRLWPLLGNQAHWISVSDLAKRALEDIGIRGHTSRVIPNSISLNSIVGAPKRTREVFTAGYFGSRRTVKGFRLLPCIAEALATRGIRLRVYTDPGRTGNPAANDDITARLEAMDNVELVGHQSDLRGEYASCDVVLAPSLRESFGRVPVEALANGVPVVASDIDAFRYLAAASGAVMLFDLNAPDSAAATIAALREAPDRLSTLGALGPPFAAQFHPHVVSSAVMAVYRQALKRHAIS
jgi:phosphatidylinositol alpha-mannosyltransferase